MSAEASTPAASSPTPAERKKVIVWADGCFDMMHAGHANALRQAKALGDYLIVGVHSDEEIMRHKGPTVMTEEERYKAVECCKWVDEIVRDAPYVTSLKLLEQYNVDFCVHGEDISVGADGRDSYWEIKEAGKFKVIKRTDGVSTTDIVGRMLLMTKDHFADAADLDPSSVKSMAASSGSEVSKPAGPISFTHVSNFLPTSRKIVQFSSGRVPKPDDRIVYVDGAWDLFHAGHMELLQKAHQFGDFVIVGIHDDKTVNEHKGGNFPIMNLHERTLTVLACSYVDEVVIGAPYQITREMIETLHISAVVHGTVQDHIVTDSHPYKIAAEMGIYRQVPSPRPHLTAGAILQRVVENRMRYEKRNKSKEVKDAIAMQQAEKNVQEY